ncbi:MAG TPA: hypothetical protein VGB01_02945 [candidate division Zixibacteria bacterium]|jgi:hypothetical protein
MNGDREKQILDLIKTTEEKAESELNSTTFNMEKNMGLEISQKYKTIFNCRYTEIKE